jgi:hypothetical protein
MASGYEAEEAAVEQAKELILDGMCKLYHRWGDRAQSDREQLQRELNIPPTVFGRAVRELVSNGFLAFVATSIRLDRAGVARCEESARR